MKTLGMKAGLANGRLERKCLFGHCEGKAEQVELGEGKVLSLDRNHSSALDFDYDNHLISRTNLNFLPQQ